MSHKIAATVSHNRTFRTAAVAPDSVADRTRSGFGAIGTVPRHLSGERTEGLATYRITKHSEYQMRLHIERSREAAMNIDHIEAKRSLPHAETDRELLTASGRRVTGDATFTLPDPADDLLAQSAADDPDELSDGIGD